MIKRLLTPENGITAILALFGLSGILLLIIALGSLWPWLQALFS